MSGLLSRAISWRGDTSNEDSSDKWFLEKIFSFFAPSLRSRHGLSLKRGFTKSPSHGESKPLLSPATEKDQVIDFDVPCDKTDAGGNIAISDAPPQLSICEDQESRVMKQRGIWRPKLKFDRFEEQMYMSLPAHVLRALELDTEHRVQLSFLAKGASNYQDTFAKMEGHLAPLNSYLDIGFVRLESELATAKREKKELEFRLRDEQQATHDLMQEMEWKQRSAFPETNEEHQHKDELLFVLACANMYLHIIALQRKSLAESDKDIDCLKAENAQLSTALSSREEIPGGAELGVAEKTQLSTALSSRAESLREAEHGVFSSVMDQQLRQSTYEEMADREWTSLFGTCDQFDELSVGVCLSL